MGSRCRHSVPVSLISGTSKPIEDFYDTIQNYVLSAFCPPFSLLEEKPGEGREEKFVRARPRFASVVEAVGRVSGAPLSAACSPFPRFQHNSISRFILQARCYLVRPPEFPRRPRIIRHLPSYNNGTTEGLAPTPPTPPPPPPALAAMPEHWYWLIFPTVM